ncbi:hypothetical protein BCV70DRAFT_199027 [Testicularia cyperi]|uniref:Uncharacterized protein n=1 Tax=Testicularia cyperi TaxID=1882483 RepID=A0A317XTD2_9BASI|nr:hypothetical protein BCV70DRAFT_199027 [Testicularia cyperi]
MAAPRQGPRSAHAPRGDTRPFFDTHHRVTFCLLNERTGTKDPERDRCNQPSKKAGASGQCR